MKTKVIRRNPHVWSLVSASSLAFALTFASAAYAEDPYIQLSGSSGISTGYRMKGGISRVEVDFALTETAGSAQTWIFGSDNMETVLKTFCYFTGSGVGSGISFRVRGGEYIATPVSDPDLASKTGDRGWGHAADTDRRTFIVDLKNGRDVIVTGTTTNLNASFSPSLLTGLVSALPLSIFAKFNNTNATTFASSVKGKIYGVKIYENYDMASADNSSHLIHNFVPCLKDGETPCFKDLVGGGFIIGENVEVFSVGGDNVPTYQDDAYVSTVSGKGSKMYINTGYNVKDSTRVELDCAIATNMIGNAQWYLFDSKGSAESGEPARFQFNFNYSSGDAMRWSAGGNKFVTGFSVAFKKPADDREVRRTFILDNYGNRAAIETSDFVNIETNFENSASCSGTYPLIIGAYYTGSSFHAPIKIYGLKIFESGVPVREFKPFVRYDYATGTVTPGLRDSLTGAFVSGSDSSNGGNVLTYGGAIDGEQDAYIESNGSTGMNTGYKMKGAVSRIEMDFSLTETNNAASKYVYGDNAIEGKLQSFLYFTSTRGFKFCNRPYTGNGDDNAYSVYADLERHTVVQDLSNTKTMIVTGSTVKQMNFPYNFADVEADYPLPIFARYKTNTSGYQSMVTARIYSVRFYENYVEGGNNTPVHELIPYSRGGVVGFYDTVTGEIVKNDNAAAGAFTFGGAGTDHGELKAYLKPGAATKITKSESQTKTLTAYAAGATSYRWYRDGQLVDDDNDGMADGADGILPVKWVSGGVRTETGYRHMYQAKAVFNLYGVERESEPTAEAQVTSIYLGTMLLIQ